MTLRMLILVATLGFFASTLSAAQSDVEKQSQAITAELTTAADDWPKRSTSGTSIRAVEVSRQGSSGRDLVVKYHFFVDGLSKDSLLEYVNWPVNARQPVSAMQGISIGKDGLLICAGRTDEQCGDPKKKDDPIEFTFIPVKGEPYRVGFDSEGGGVFTVLVPDPIVGKDKNCTLNVVRLTPKFELAYFHGTGFMPDAEVRIDMQSYDEKHTIVPKADAAGNLRFAILPGVAGREKGKTTIKAHTTECSPSLEFDWGR